VGRVDVTVEICGMSGDGTIAAGGLLNAAISAAGFSILGFDSYPAEIRGFGRCVTRSRIGDDEIVALEDRVDVLISLDDIQSQSRIPFLAEDAAVFFENNPPAYVKEEDSLAARLEPGVHLYGMPLADLSSGAAGSSRGRNLTALGGFAAVYGVSAEAFRNVIRRKFESKGHAVVDANLKSFDAGYDYARRIYSDRMREALSAMTTDEGPEKVMLSGNLAVGKAAIDAGLKLYFGYPITPATPIMEYLATELPRAGGSVVQMEDEIASIAAVLGGFFSGARSMTATSGPGFALMTELITHGVMTETPAVIVNVQRGGPSTGLPTKTEQSDLHASVFGGPGDSLRIVVAPSDVAECYRYTVRSFQWAERYQTPVIVLTDFFLGNRIENLPMPEASEAEVADWNEYPDDANRYQRFEVTDSGISPRSLPGMEGFEFSATGLEHVASGVPDYSAEVHTLMSDKRMRKIRGALSDLPPPQEYSGGGKLRVGVIGWGSTFGSVLEAVRIGLEKGYEVGALKITSLFPYHEDEIREFMGRCDEVLIPELNLQGQLANLIGHLHSRDVVRVDRATGVPLPPSAILKEIESLLEVDTA
jgi:2-oxoglutarate ferredoxin oxidoreductase subunit alpha